MIDLDSKNHCICQKMSNTRKECLNDYTLHDSGISLKLEPKSASERVCLIVIDNCLINDTRKRCDGLFLYKKGTNHTTLLVELKGSHIRDAFEQLACTQTYNEYINIIKEFGSFRNYSAIASSTIVNKVEKEKLENEFDIRVKVILHTTSTTSIPNLRDYI